MILEDGPAACPVGKHRDPLSAATMLAKASAIKLSLYSCIVKLRPCACVTCRLKAAPISLIEHFHSMVYVASTSISCKMFNSISAGKAMCRQLTRRQVVVPLTYRWCSGTAWCSLICKFLTTKFCTDDTTVFRCISILFNIGLFQKY